MSNPIVKMYYMINLFLLSILLSCCSKRNLEMEMATNSMAPTIKANSKFSVNRRAYSSIRDIERWDIVAFYDPQNRDSVAVKRVVALPGEQISITAQTIFLNGRVLDIPTNLNVSYNNLLFPPHYFSDDQPSWRLSMEAIFVIGDKAKHSRDSRNYGPIVFNDIIGKVELR